MINVNISSEDIVTYFVFIGGKMFTYRDRTYCVNKECKKECSTRLTPEIEENARLAGMPLAVAEYDCGKEEDDSNISV